MTSKKPQPPPENVPINKPVSPPPPNKKYTNTTPEPMCSKCNGRGIISRPYITGTPYECVSWYCDCRKGMEQGAGR